MSGQMIKCRECENERAEFKFSSNQLDIYRRSRQAARGPRAPIQYPRCMDCSSQPPEERECAQCQLTLPRKSFSRAQFKQKEDAQCNDCMQSNQDIEPNLFDQAQEEANLDALRNGGSTMNRHYGSMMSQIASSADKSSFNSNCTGGPIRTAPFSAASSNHGYVPHCRVSPSNNSFNTNIPTLSAMKNTALADFIKPGGMLQVSTWSTASSADSNSKFTKPKATKEDPHEKAERVSIRERGQEATRAQQAGSLRKKKTTTDDDVDPY